MYIINDKTLYLSYDGWNTIINENSTELILSNNVILNILDNSCIYYGSSLSGRIKGTKNILKSRYRLPIIINESKNIIFFPIKGCKNDEVIWFNYEMIESYSKNKEFVEIVFKNNLVKKFLISYAVFNNQILKCSRLLIVHQSR